MMLLVLLVAVCANTLVLAQQQQGYDNYQQQQQQQQYQQPHQQQQPLSAIVMHKQALGQDGTFNYAFSADNGLQQGESISPDGSRTGQYSYVDPNGKTISVKYSAGKEGFKILEGDHVPRAPQPQAQPQQQYQQPQYQQPQYQPQGAALYHRAQPAYQPQAGYGSESRFRDEINQISGQANFRPAPAYRVHENQGGPVTYPPPPAQQQRSNVPKYFRAANNGNQQQQDEEPEHQGPHNFGNGYSFEFAG